MEKENFFSAKNITWMAILLALVISLQSFGGAINIGPVQLNFTLIPIVLGAVVLGPIAGAILGLASGIVVTIQVIMGLVPFYTLIWTYSPVVAVLTCIVKSTAAGLVAGLLYKLIAKKNSIVALFVASATVPIVNTGLFIVGCLCMWDTIAMAAGGTDVFGFILVSLVTFNFFAELGVNLLVSPPLSRVINVIEKRLG